MVNKFIYAALIAYAVSSISACSSTGGGSIDGEGDLPVQQQGDKLARTNVQLGVGYMKRGKYEFALNKLRKALSIDDSLPDGHYAIAILYERLNKPSHADRHYKRAIELDPQYSDARNAYGVYLCRNKEYARADEQFKLALKNPLYKTPQQAMLNAGVCLMQSGNSQQHKRAETYFRNVLRVNPRAAAALKNMSVLSVEQGDYLRGRAYLQRYLDVGKHTAETLWLGIRIERRLGDKVALAKYTEMLRTDFPDSDELVELDKSIQ